MSLSNAAILFKEQFGAYLAENTKVEFVNLSGFAEARYSIRINDPLNDSKLGKQAGLVVGVILLMLLTYMLAIFAGGTIEKERAIIGTLYALGYSKKEILSHYMKIPLAITLIGSFIGLFGGFALVDFLAASYAAMYSFPELVRVYPLYVEAYAVGMPLALAYCINRHVLKKKLDETPLQMMHEKVTGIGRMNFELHGMSFSGQIPHSPVLPRDQGQFDVICRRDFVGVTHDVFVRLLRQHFVVYRQHCGRCALRISVCITQPGGGSAKKRGGRLHDRLQCGLRHDRRRNGSDAFGH